TVDATFASRISQNPRMSAQRTPSNFNRALTPLVPCRELGGQIELGLDAAREHGAFLEAHLGAPHVAGDLRRGADAGRPPGDVAGECAADDDRGGVDVPGHAAAVVDDEIPGDGHVAVDSPLDAEVTAALDPPAHAGTLAEDRGSVRSLRAAPSRCRASSHRV